MTPPPATNALRILHLNSLLNGGGTDDQCLKLAAGLHRLGQAVWIAGPEGRELSKTVRELGVPFYATPSEGFLKLRLICSVARFIRNERLQIVHGHHGRDLWATVLAARLSGRRPKIVLTRHLAKSPKTWFSRWFLLSQCDALIAVSNSVAQVLRKGAYEPDSPEPERWARPPMRGDHGKFYVLPGGIDTERFRPQEALARRREWGLGPEHYVFAVVGGYSRPRGKGQREFLQAAARIHNHAPRARFLMIGRGDLANLLQEDIQRLGLAGKAWLTPYCHDMPQAMNAIDCLVHPAVGTEAFAGVVLEAFACGKPVIASALDGMPEAFAAGNQGRLVPPEDIAALADAMVEWLQRPPLTSAQREELHQRIARGHSLPVCGERMVGLYQRLLSP